MENKYYTPEIEELHVGFECELKNSSHPINFEWEHFKIIGVDDAEISGRVMDWSFYDTNTAIKEKSIRVKYLDRDDIEELGFEYTGESPNNPNTLYYFGKHSIIHNKINNRCVITMWDENRTADYTAFVGTIKNKSELKKLMVQLGIK